MNAVYPFQRSPRCTATSKRTQRPCQAPAVNGWSVCRFHGAGGGAPKRKRNGNYRDGEFTGEMKASRSAVSSLLKLARETLVKGS